MGLNSLFKLIAKLLNKLIYNQDLSNYYDTTVVATNLIILLAILVSFFRVVLYSINSEFVYAYTSIVSCSCFCLLLILNHKGYYNFAKYFLLIVGSIATGYKELIAGGNGGQIYLILASFGIVFIIFDARDTKKLVYALLIPLTNTIITVFFATIIREPIVQI